jgi:hypothetical protein
MFKYYASCIHELLSDLVHYKCHSAVIQFLSEDSCIILNTLSKIFDITLDPASNNIFGVANNSEINDMFNETKSVILMTLKLIFKYISNKPYQDPQSKNSLVFKQKHLQELFEAKSKIMIESIYQIYRKPGLTLEDIEDVSSLNDVLILSFSLLCKVVEDQLYYNIFSVTSKPLFLEILLINLITTKDELSLMETDEIEFCQLFHDACYEQVLSLNQRNPKH